MDLTQAVEDTAIAFDACEGLADAALLLTRIKDAQRNLAVLARDVEQEVAARMDDPAMEVPGVGYLERHKVTKKVTWDSDALFGEACKTDDPLATLRACLPLTGSLSWRSRALTDHGIDPDDFREREWTDRYSVRITGAS
jgi:hypothetical protein